MRQWSMLGCVALLTGSALAAGDDVPAPGRNMAAELQAEFEREKAIREPEAPSVRPRAPGAQQGRTYTADELRARIARNDYPPQWPPETTKVSMGYGECLIAVQATADAARQAGHPAETPVMTNLARITKIWARDAAIVLTCSRLDQVQVRTVSRYR